MKTCPKCKKKKSLNDFRKHSGKIDGRQSHCKICEDDDHRQWYKRDRKNILKRKKKRDSLHRDERARFLINYLKIHPCIDCGESDPIVLEFDHVKGHKKFAIGSMLFDLNGMKRIMKEIDKCVVRCANCHRRKTAKQFNYRKWKFMGEARLEEYRSPKPTLAGSNPVAPAKKI